MQLKLFSPLTEREIMLEAADTLQKIKSKVPLEYVLVVTRAVKMLRQCQKQKQNKN